MLASASYPPFLKPTSRLAYLARMTRATAPAALLAILLTTLLLGPATAWAQTPVETAPAETAPAAEKAPPKLGEEPAPQAPPKLPAPKGAKRLSKTDQAWIDAKNDWVIVDGRVSLRQGPLEMFACTKNSKEHESVVVVDSKAFVLHAALLAAGAEPISPVKFVPRYVPPRGTEIEIEVHWMDEKGKHHKARAQDWVRNSRTQKAMKLSWVFAGSGFWRDEETGEQGYMAEGGDLICVSNFSSAMLDVPAESSSENSGLFFEAFTEKIPPLGWPVRLILKPVLEKEKENAKKQEKPSSTSPKEPAPQKKAPPTEEKPEN